MSPEITVLIPARNGQKYIGDAIESVLAQSFENWRLVVSDDASTDRTREVVKRYTGDRRVELIESPKNLGMAGNWNRCLEQVRSEYFMVLCQDDLLYRPHSLQAAYQVLRDQPAIPTVYCDLMFVDGARRPLLTRRFHRAGRIDTNRLAKQSIFQTRNAFGVALLFRTSAVGNARYDPALALAIDIDFSIAVAKGNPIYHLPEPLIGYRYHGENQTGVLLSRLVPEITHIANKNGMVLKLHHRVMMRILSHSTNLGRKAVLWYARRRKRLQD